MKVLKSDGNHWKKQKSNTLRVAPPPATWREMRRARCCRKRSGSLRPSSDTTTALLCVFTAQIYACTGMVPSRSCCGLLCGPTPVAATGCRLLSCLCLWASPRNCLFAQQLTACPTICQFPARASGQCYAPRCPGSCVLRWSGIISVPAQRALATTQMPINTVQISQKKYVPH